MDESDWMALVCNELRNHHHHPSGGGGTINVSGQMKPIIQFPIQFELYLFIIHEVQFAISGGKEAY